MAKLPLLVILDYPGAESKHVQTSHSRHTSLQSLPLLDYSGKLLQKTKRLWREEKQGGAGR